LKGQKGKPLIKRSRMDKEVQGGEEAGKERKRGPQNSKSAQLQAIDEVIVPEGLPADAREQGCYFKGYADYMVQDLVIEARNRSSRLEEWQGPDGQWLRVKLPYLSEQLLQTRVGELRAGPIPSSNSQSWATSEGSPTILVDGKLPALVGPKPSRATAPEKGRDPPDIYPQLPWMKLWISWGYPESPVVTSGASVGLARESPACSAASV
jgi:hypothetical protein